MSEIEPAEPVSPEEWHGDARAPYDRLDDESAAAFHYFVWYRNLGYQRTIAAVGKEFGIARRTMQQYASRFSWQRRAEAWDDYIDRQARRELEADIINERKITAAAARQMRQKALDRMLSMDPNDMAPRDVATWFDLATKLSRQAHGDVEVKRTEITGKDGGPIQLVEKMDTAERDALMAAVRAQLDARLGTPELEGEIEDADIVDDE